MDKVVCIESFISGLSKSGIYIDYSEITVNISKTYVHNCQTTKGAGIYAISKSTNIDRTCLSYCYASVGASALYTTSNTMLERTSIYKCAPEKYGEDDNICIEYGEIFFTELNISNIQSKGATCCQYIQSNQIIMKQIIHSNCSSLDRDSESKGKFIEILNGDNPTSIKDSIFVNSFAYQAVEFAGTAGPVDFDNCYFSNNKLTIFFRARLESIPKISFSNVIITDSIALGTKGLTTVTSGDMPELLVGFETGECFGNYSRKMKYDCEQSCKVEALPTTVIAFFAMLFILLT